MGAMSGPVSGSGAGGGRYVAVDGGNSKTDVVIGTAAADVLAFVRGPGSSPDPDPPVAGAALLAIDAWGATTPRLEERLRQAVRAAAGR